MAFSVKHAQASDYLMLYSSTLLNGKIEYRSEIINIEDSYRTAGNVEDVYNRWNKITNKAGHFYTAILFLKNLGEAQRKR
jgi:hypothetical protein